MKSLVVILCLGVLHLRTAVLSADVCKDDLTVTYANGKTASSQMAPNDKQNNYGPDRAQLNAVEAKDAAGVTQMGAWVAEKNNFNQWIQVELKDASMIRGLITQGRDGSDKQWVTRYRVFYSEDCKHWHTVGGFNVTDKFFDANTDEKTAVTNMFHCPVMAKCIRVNPLGWHKNIALRLSVLGCPLDLHGTTTTKAPLPTTTQAPVTTQPTTQPTTTQPTTQPTTQTTTTQPTTQPTTTKSTTQKPTQPPTTQTTTQLTTQKPTQPPTQPPTQAPTTTGMATQKSGGNNSVGGPGLKQGACIKTCLGRANGDYQSCKGCNFYVTCVWSSMYGHRQCPNSLIWDDNVKRCVGRGFSTTCH